MVGNSLDADILMRQQFLHICRHRYVVVGHGDGVRAVTVGGDELLSADFGGGDAQKQQEGSAKYILILFHCILLFLLFYKVVDVAGGLIYRITP